MNDKKMGKLSFLSGKMRKFLIFYLIALLVGISFWGGLTVGQKSFSSGKDQGLFSKDSQPADLSGDVSLDLFKDVWDLVEKEYVKQPVSEKDLFYGSLAGMVAALKDPYSVFFDPKTTNEFTQELAGSFEGIGAEIGIRQDRLTIIAPLADTPAEKAGLKAGDKIYAIDGKDTTGMPLDLAVSLIRGEKGTQVVLSVIRQGSDKPKDITIVRGTIKIKVVKSEMKDSGIAYVQLTYFNETTVPEFKEAIMKLMEQKPKGIVLDLRNNPGGFLDVAVDVVNFWVENDVAVIEKFSEGNQQEYKTKGGALLKDIKTVVLANGGSASASEIVAGALQDYQKATLVGEKTFGKGSVQSFNRLTDGSAVKLTVAEWLTPKGRSINEKGIEPDIEVKLTEDDLNAGRDPQLKKAMEIIKGTGN